MMKRRRKCLTNELTSRFERIEDRRMFAAGALDTSFSGDGLATFPFLNGGTEAARNVAVQSDGKTVVVGQTDIAVQGFPTITKFAVARFNLDGTPDRTFGQFQTGKTTIEVGDKDDAAANAVAIQPDGKILIAGHATIDQGTLEFDGPLFAIVRLNPNGTLDTSFDGDGKRLIDFGDGVCTAEDIIVQGDGKILVVGNNLDSGLTGQDFNFAVARLNPNGSLDGSFDGDGLKQIGFGDDDFGESVTIDPAAQKIIIAGRSGGLDGSATRIAVARLNLSNGSVDVTFGPAGNGTVVTRFPGRRDASANGVMVQSGKIVIAGTTGDATITNGMDFVVGRYLANGQLDTTFGAAHTGLVEIGFGGKDEAFDISQAANGGFVTAGTSNGKFALAGLTADGLMNNSFGTLGKVVTDANVPQFGSVGLAKGPGRRFVVAGGAVFKTARYLDAGANVVTVGTFDASSTEGGTNNASFIVARLERLPVPTRVFFSIGGTATRPGSPSADYTLGGMTVPNPLLGTPFVDIPANQTFVVVTFTPRDDTVVEATETATFSILPNASYELGTPAATAISIADNDGLVFNSTTGGRGAARDAQPLSPRNLTEPMTTTPRSRVFSELLI
jgi:uncharacterized delta-60 repeat protein